MLTRGEFDEAIERFGTVADGHVSIVDMPGNDENGGPYRYATLEVRGVERIAFVAALAVEVKGYLVMYTHSQPVCVQVSVSTPLHEQPQTQPTEDAHA